MKGKRIWAFLMAASVAVAQQAGGCGPRCQKIQAEIREIQGKLESIYIELLLFSSEIIDEDPQQSTFPTLQQPSTVSNPSSNSEYSITQHTTQKQSATGLPDPSTTATRSIKPSESSTPQIEIPVTTMNSSEGYRSVAYFANWGIYGRGYTPDKIPVEKLTHILYAFADNREDGTVFLTDTWSDIEKHYEGDSWNDVGKNMYGSLKQLNLAKRRNRNLKIMLSIGGWTYTNTNKHFDGPAGSPEGRQRFADSCVDLIKDLGFDGIDLDWEYPQNPGQGEQFLLLIQAIRKAMDAYAHTLVSKLDPDQSDTPAPKAPHFEISIASPAGKDNYDNLPLGRLADALDFINLMGYDFSGAWEKNASHQANLYRSKDCPDCTPYAIHDVITDYVAAGVPSSKIVLGMPLYGRAFTNTGGLGQAFQGVGEGSWENGIWDYNVLPRPGHTEHYDKEADASYSYDKESKTLISYDTVPMARRKAKYIQKHKLGGAMWWELSGDSTNKNSSLISNVVSVLGGPDGGAIERSPNWLVYPDSTYENLKSGFT